MFDLQEALNEGYTHTDIVNYLAPLSDFDLENARAEGYLDDEIASYLSEIDQIKAPQEADVTFKETDLPEGTTEQDVQDLAELDYSRQDVIDIASQPAVEEEPAGKLPEMGTAEFTEVLKQMQEYFNRQRLDEIQNLKGASALGGTETPSLSHPNTLKKEPVIQSLDPNVAAESRHLTPEEEQQLRTEKDKALLDSPDYMGGHAGMEAFTSGIVPFNTRPGVEEKYPAFHLAGELVGLAVAGEATTGVKTVGKLLTKFPALQTLVSRMAHGGATFGLKDVSDQVAEIAGTERKESFEIARTLKHVAAGAILSGATAIPKAVEQAQWYRKLTIKERGLVAQTVEDLRKQGMSDGQIARMRPDFYKQELEKRMKAEVQEPVREKPKFSPRTKSPKVKKTPKPKHKAKHRKEPSGAQEVLRKEVGYGPEEIKKKVAQVKTDYWNEKITEIEAHDKLRNLARFSDEDIEINLERRSVPRATIDKPEKNPTRYEAILYRGEAVGTPKIGLQGTHYTPSKQYAESYAKDYSDISGKVIEKQITLKKPLIIDKSGEGRRIFRDILLKSEKEINKEGKSIIEMHDEQNKIATYLIKKAGYDGVVLKNVGPNNEDEVIVFGKMPFKAEGEAKLIKTIKKPLKFNADKHTLKDWIRIKGGINYNREHMKGELDRIGESGGSKIIKKTDEGYTLDELVEQAKESGFLYKDEGINELLERLESDLSGEKVYSILKEDYWPTGAYADTGRYAETAPSLVEMPELVEFARELAKGKIPKIKKKMRALGGSAAGLFRPTGDGSVELRADIFAKPGQAEKTLAHEIGHFVDYLPEKTMSRGNILGRIASLKKYMQTMISELPESSETLLTKQERTRLRTQATSEVLKLHGASHSKLKDKYFRSSIAKEISDLYKKKLSDEAKYRGLITKADVTAELKKLTQEWKPFDENKVPARYKKYRYSSAELYADAFSVLLNSPELLKQTAPKFYKSLFGYMERKPEVKSVYDEIQARIKDKKAIYEKRSKHIREMFKRGEKAYSAKTDTASRDYVERLKEELIDVNEAIIRKVKQAGPVSPEDNPVFWLEEAAYRNSQVKEYLRDVHEIIKTLEAADIGKDDLAELLFHNRVINERTEVANPLGFTPETSQEQLEVLKAKLGDEKYDLLGDMAQAFREFRKESIIPFLKESGMFSPQLMEKIENNEHYATFNLVDFLEEKSGRGAGIGAYIFKQYGTLSEITSPFTATVMKDMALIRAANVKLSAEKTVDFLKQNYSEEIKKADTEWNGKARIPVEPKDPDLEMIRYLQDGKVQAYYVDKYIADSFNHNPSEAGLVAEILRNTNIVWRELFVNRNPGFWLFNLMRDFKRAAVNLPGGSIANLLPEYRKALKPSFKEAFNIPDDVVSEMNKKKMLISIESRWGLAPEDAEIERMLQSYGLKESKWNNLIMKKFAKIWQHWGNIGQGIERIPKIAGYNWLKKRTNLTEKEIGHVVRTQVGSPDFLRKGKSYNLYNNLFLFSNAIKEGWRGDIEAAKARPSEYAWKRAKYSLIPKIIMYGASLGLLGAWMSKSMENVSEFDKSNYIVIPLGELENGKTVYLRVPMDETGRFISGVFWKAVTARKIQDLTDLLDYMAGQAPTLTPTVGIVSDTIQYFSGKNPYDWFRGREAIPEREFEAGGWRSHKEFLKHQAKQAGSGIIYKFPYNDLDKNKSLIEKILDAPILSNIVGRFIKVSDTGQRQQFKEIKEDIRKEVANKQLNLRDKIVEHVNEHKGKARAGEIIKFYHRLKKDGLIEKKIYVEGEKVERKPVTSLSQFRQKYSRYASQSKDNPKIDAVIFARTNDEKVALLVSYMTSMSRSKYKRIEVQLLKEGHISKTALVRARLEGKKVRVNQ